MLMSVVRNMLMILVLRLVLDNEAFTFTGYTLGLRRQQYVKEIVG